MAAVSAAVDRVRRQNGERRTNALANALGWFSIGLGLAEVTAPNGIARLIGLRDQSFRDRQHRHRGLMRALGVREMVSGVGILSRRQRAGWVWSRVAGDIMDVALLGRVLTADRTRKRRAATATAVVLGIGALDVLCGQRLSKYHIRHSGATMGNGADDTADETATDRDIRVKKGITVNRAPDEAYRYWRDLENLPLFMRNLRQVHITGPSRSHWIVEGPGGRTVEWDAEIVDDRADELIAWRSVEGSDVTTAGSVRFTPAPGGRGTEVRVEMSYGPPAGRLGVFLAKITGDDPARQVAEDLHAFKQVLETGEVVMSDASVHRGPHPARPSRGSREPAHA